jgi:uroporphyrinogen decarboxylase
MQRDWNQTPRSGGDPDFENLLCVLRKEKPARPTLFEFFLNGPLYRRLAGPLDPSWPQDLATTLRDIHAFRNAGYDYARYQPPGFYFECGERDSRETVSLNAGALIHDRVSFDAYPWPDPDGAHYSPLDELLPYLPVGMKLVVSGPGGVLENAIALVGYESLCYLMVDRDPLIADVFERIGSCLLGYYERCVQHDAVGAIIGNDDWGFKSQTMVSPDDLRRFVFPWHKKIVAAAHAAGRPAILHSCGFLGEVMDDVIDDMRYDGKHSYEDIIQPVEEAYDIYHERIAIMGGIDVDFVCRSSPDDVYARSQAMLAHATDGAFALGTGNSVPEYVPACAYFAMISAALDSRNGSSAI